MTSPLPRSALDGAGNPLGPFRVVRRPTLAVSFLAFRVRQVFRGEPHPFQDVRVRRAVSLALDRERLVREALDGDGRALWQLAPPGIVGFEPSVASDSPDPVVARRLLAEAGFPEGFSSRLVVDTDRVRAGREIARQLAEVGVRLEVEVLPWDEVFRRMLFGMAPVALASSNIATGHVSSFYESFLHSSGPDSLFGAENFSRYSDPAVDAMLERAAEAVPPGVREELLVGVRRKALEDLPYIPLDSPSQTYGVRNGIDFTPRLDRAVFAADVHRSRS